MRRLVLALALAIPLVALAGPSAGADGLPVPMDGFGTASVVRPDGEGKRYAAVGSGENTALMAIDQDGGEITGTRMIDGDFTVPLVAIDGTPSGLSADGRTLALISPRTNFRFPRGQTTFVIVDVGGRRMRPEPPLTLRGDFSFDALSPDGTSMFLIEYLSRDYNDYAVREYDLQRERLLPEPVLVAHEVSPGEMRGLPLTRTTSPDGRWEYTLYDGGGRRSDQAFIHTLDTVESISHCVDLPMLAGRGAHRVDLELSADARTLNVTRGPETLATLDTETFALREPSAPVALDQSGGGGGGGVSGLAIGAIATGTAMAVGTALGLRRRRHGQLPPDPFGPDAPRPAQGEIREHDRAVT